MATPSIDAAKQLAATERLIALLEVHTGLLESLPARLAAVLNEAIGRNTAAALAAIDRRRRRRSPIPQKTDTTNGTAEAAAERIDS